ncbi:hypothetical protein Pcinc_012387 [Petrolisthes cinctipes]|uniref:Uncharacterized protein n=1 Tax=Petrolisthes cinctipes TaxID=88211 RepID=A0AAE1G1G5_PETCI|nr:hypothetical protein Pcinc_012387 [Petrolisthes cinctipes]
MQNDKPHPPTNGEKRSSIIISVPNVTVVGCAAPLDLFISTTHSEEVDVPEVDATSPIIDTEESESQLDPHDSDSDLDYEPLPMSQSETEEEEGSQETTTTQQSPTPQQSTTTEAETNKYIHKLTSSDRRAPDKTLWSRKPLPPKPPQQAPQNYEKGLATNEAKNAVTPGDFLSLIIDDDMINIIVTCTNRMIEKKSKEVQD